MTDVTLGLRFTADQRELQAASDKGVEAIRRQGDQAKKSNDEARKAAEQHTAALKRQADTLGMSRSQVMAYESAQHKMTEAQRQSAAASISSIDAYERKTAMLGRVRIAAGAAGAALGVALVAGLKGSIAAAAEAEQAQLRLEAVLRGTGYAAGFTGAELDKMASRMQDRLGIDDETIKKAMATLLTFRQVRRESFGEALEIAANISAVMGSDLQSATLQLGKALENPEQGLTALTRSGVSFNETQKAMIVEMVETGRQADAITTILDVMKKQGLDKVAESMHSGITKESSDLKNVWDDLLEAIGKTGAVKGITVSVLSGITRELRGIKDVIEEGDWVDVLDSFFTPRGTKSVRRQNREAANEPAADGAGERYAMRLGDERKARDAAREQVTTFLNAFKSDNDKLAEEVRKFRALADNAGLSAADTDAGLAKIQAKFAKKKSKESTAGAQLVMSLTEQLQQVSGDASVFDKVMRQVTEGTQKFTAAEIAAALSIAGEIDEMKRAKVERDGYVKAAESLVQQWQREDETLAQLNESLSDQAQGLQLEIDMMGATDAQRDKAIALRELDNKFRKETVDLQGKEWEAANRLYQQERERIGGLLDQRGAAQERKKAADDAKDERKRFDDDLARGLTDSIFRGFEGGKTFARNFFDALKNMAKTTILQPVVKFLVSPITSAIGGALGSLGIPGMATASGGAGGIGGGSADLLQNASSLFSLGNGASFASGYAATAGLGAAEAAAMIEAGTVGFAGAGMEAGALGLGASGMAGTALSAALPYVGLAIAAYSMLKSDKGGPASFTGMSASGTASRDALDLAMTAHSQNSKQQFSWQHNDAYVAPALQGMIGSVFDTMETLGKSLKLDTTKLNSASIPFNVNFQGQGTAVEKAAQIAEQLGVVSDALALELMPNLRDFAQANETLTQTLVRLAEAQRAADLNKIFGNMQGALQLADQTRDLWLSDLSPLTAKQRLDEAQGRYGETLAKAQGGDLGAMGQLSGMARSYLGEARGYYASSADYTGIFGDVQAQIGNLVEDTLVEQSIAFSEMGIPLETIAENTKDLDTRIAAALGAALAASGAASDAAVRAQTEALIRANQDLARTLQGFIDAGTLA